MKLPSITIAFQTAGIAAIARSEKGVVALLLRGSEDEAQTYMNTPHLQFANGLNHICCQNMILIYKIL